MTVTKAELNGQLQNLRNTFFVGIAACYVLADERALLLLMNHPFDVVAERLSKPENRRFEVLELQKFILRVMLKEPFELIKDYCVNSNQEAAFKSQTWYQFARMIRNNVSHNMRFDFRPQEVGLLPVTWNGITINSTMNGQPLTFDFLNPKDVNTLITEMQNFVVNTLP